MRLATDTERADYFSRRQIVDQQKQKLREEINTELALLFFNSTVVYSYSREAVADMCKGSYWSPPKLNKDSQEGQFRGKWRRKSTSGLYPGYCDHALTEETCSHCKTKRRMGKSKSEPNDPPRLSQMILTGGEPSPVALGLAIDLLEYPNKKHKTARPLKGEKLDTLIDVANVREAIEQAKNNPAAHMTCPVIKGNADLQKQTQQLYAEWNRILNAVGKVLDSDPKYRKQPSFGQRMFRKSGGVDGSCSRCGSELFLEKKRQIICYDCGKYSVAPKKGKLPFRTERAQWNDIRNSDEDMENIDSKEETFLTQSVSERPREEEHDYSIPTWGDGISMGDILLTKGFTDFSTKEARTGARKVDRRATWLYDSSKLFDGLCRKFPLIRNIDGKLRTNTYGMTSVGKTDYRRQFKEAASMFASVYYGLFLGPDQALTDEMLAFYFGGTPEEKKRLRERFIDTGSAMFGQESGQRLTRREERTETESVFTTQTAFVFRKTGKKYLNVSGAWATNPPTGNIELDRVYRFAYARNQFCAASWATIPGRNVLFDQNAGRSGYYDPVAKQRFPHATYTRAVSVEILHPTVAETYKLKWATIRRLLLSCPPSEIRALLTPRLRIVERRDSRFQDLGTRFSKYASLEYRLPCSLEQAKFGTCACGRNRMLMSTADGGMACSTCLDSFGGWENVPANFLKGPQNISPLLATT